ncbi:MAG: XRE family transcriptional regulator [Phycisphaerales bacterium]
MPKRHKALVNSRVLQWAREAAGLEVKEASKAADVGADVLSRWEAGAEQPSLAQARRLAEVYRRPLAALFLPRPPAEPKPPRDFRRFDTGERTVYSAELRLLIRKTRNRQDWARARRLELGWRPLEFVGAWREPKNAAALAKEIRECAQFPLSAQLGASDADQVFRDWLVAIERAGAFVTRDASVSPTEARGFALCDPVAPFIYVNPKDSKGGRLFTLLHEFVHIWLGESGVSNDAVGGEYPSGAGAIERFCNAVAAETLVPMAAFGERWSTRPGSPANAGRVIDEASREFKVSREVIARRLLEMGELSQPDYLRLRAGYAAEWTAQQQRARKRPGGPSYYTLRASQAGRALGRSVFEALRARDLSERDAADLLEVKVGHLGRMRAEFQRSAPGAEADN